MVPPWRADFDRLFWDVDVRHVDLVAHGDYVMERVMTRGTLEAMRWLRACYRPEQLSTFLERKGHRLAARDRAYWRLVAGLPGDDRPGGAQPPWAGR